MDSETRERGSGPTADVETLRTVGSDAEWVALRFKSRFVFANFLSKTTVT